jgi:hypothetical protein
LVYELLDVDFLRDVLRRFDGSISLARLSERTERMRGWHEAGFQPARHASGGWIDELRHLHWVTEDKFGWREQMLIWNRIVLSGLTNVRQPLEALAGALSSRATDSLRVSVVTALPESPFNLAKVAGTTLTGRDWSSDFARLQNIDVPLSSRASEATLSGIAGQLDVKLSVLSRLIKWGRDVTPFWVHGGEVTAPAAGTALVSWTVPSGRVGYIYGFFISAGEGNDFKLNWTSGGVAYSRRIVFPGKSTLHFVDVIALNEGLPADAGTSITITNVNAGSAGIVYQAALLVVAV